MNRYLINNAVYEEMMWQNSNSTARCSLTENLTLVFLVMFNGNIIMNDKLKQDFLFISMFH